MKLKLKAKIIGLLAFSGISFALYNKLSDKLDTKTDTIRIENTIGFDNINPLLNLKIDKDNFAIINIGDSKRLGSIFEERKLKLCNKSDIALGLIVNSTATKENEIYDDVELVKKMITDYNVSFPVYLNIDNIITNNDLNIEMKTKLIRNFLEKCSSNKIYVGVYGTDENLCRMKKYCKITEYDAFVVMQKEKISYDGTYNLIKDTKGNITSKINLEELIKKLKLNKKENLINDKLYVVKNKDDILDIAMNYGMSVNELLKYNNMKEKDIKIGTKIRIPMLTENQQSNNLSFTKLDIPIKGCDLSYAQADTPDWNFIKENYEFVIIKCSQGLEKDEFYDKNVLNCLENNIPFGVYCYNDFTGAKYQDLKEFELKQKMQANFVLNNLKNKNITYPVYLDIEGNLNSLYSKEHIKIMLDVWKKEISNAGYIPGIYCNQSGYDYITSMAEYDISEDFEIWVAGGNQYSSEANPTPVDFNKVIPSPNKFTYNGKDYTADIVQSTNVCTNGGAKDSRGFLDINYSYVNYLESQKNSSTKTDIKELNRYFPQDMTPIIILSGGVLIYGGYRIIRKKKKILSK